LSEHGDGLPCPRLALVAPQLVARIARCSPAQRRRVVARACSLAVDRTVLADRRIADALVGLTHDAPTKDDLDAGLVDIAEQLDEAAWDMQDKIEAGQASPSDYHAAFARARAAAAVAFATARTEASALESLYEAYHAVDDHDLFVREVEDAFDG
jgi:hypothetical protein